jgi:DNA-binding NarL/FixJ family response regulator
MRLFIADDHDLFRTGLRNLLEEQGAEIVGEARNGEDAIRAVRWLELDLVLIDVDMPGIGGVEATRQIAPRTPVLVLTLRDEDHDVRAATLAGARGSLLKSSSISELVTAIRAASTAEPEPS